MKRSLSISILILSLTLMVCSISHAATLELISQSYTVNAYYDDDYLSLYPDTSPSNLIVTGETPTSFSWPYWDIRAIGNSGTTNAFVETYEAYRGYATATITFLARGTSFFDVSAIVGNLPVIDYAKCGLIDATTGVELVSLINGYDGSVSLMTHIPVVPLHTYSIYATVSSGYDPSYARISITAVPEPAIFTLFIAGVLGLGFLRNRLR